jgi:Uma2 family endonuclease
MESVRAANPRGWITAEDVLRRDSPYRECELWDGIAVVREPAGGQGGAVQTNVIVRLDAHVRRNGLGRVLPAEQGYLLRRGPDLMLACDVSYVSRERLPTLPVRGFVPMAPDFAVEVRSPDDSWSSVVAKCAVWVSNGVRCVWAVNPFTRVVRVFRDDAPPVEAGIGGAVSAAPALPDFSMRVADVFDDL